MLTRLVYCSHTADHLKTEDIKDILDVSRVYNSKHHITGMLCQGNDRFIQMLEGDRVIINELYRGLVRDKRHHTQMLLSYQTAEERCFHDWSMGFLSTHDEAIRAVLLQETGHEELLPDDFTGDQAVHLIKTLKRFLNPQVIVMPDLNDASRFYH